MTIDRRVDKSAARIVRLLLDLQIGQAWDPIQLAQELGVSRRTIFRDIATLRRAGVPIHFDVQQNSYRLPQPNAKRARGLSAQEIGVLAIAAHFAAKRCRQTSKTDQRRDREIDGRPVGSESRSDGVFVRNVR